MLNVFREGAKTWVSRFLIWFVAATFVGAAFLVWGRGSTRGDEVVAVVGDEAITMRMFQNQVKRVEENLRRQFQGQLTSDILDTLNPAALAMNSLVENSVLMKAADEAGIVVTDRELRDAIESMPQFQFAGAFDSKRYVEVLQRNGVAPRVFEEDLRADMKVSKLRAMIENSVDVSEAELENQYLYDNQPVIVEYVKVDSARFEPEIEVKDEDIQKWFEAHKGDFEKPETRTFKILSVKTAPFEDSIAVSDQEVERYFNDHPSEFKIEEKVHARHILTRVSSFASDREVEEAREKIDKAAARLDAGEDFETVAKEMSEGPTAPNGGDLGEFGKGAMVPEFEKVVFSLKPGEVSEPFRTDFGWHIAQAVSRTEEKEPTLEEVRDAVENKVRTLNARAEARAFIEVAASELAPDKFEKVAEEQANAELIEGSLAKGEPLIEIPNSRPVEQALFRLEEKGISEVINLSDRFVIAMVDSIEPAATPPLADIRSRVEDAYRAELAENKAKERAGSIADKVGEGAPLSTIAQDEGLGTRKTEPFTRKSVAGGAAGEGVTREAFGLSEGEASVTPVPGGYLVITVASRPSVDADKMAESLPSLRDEVLANKRAQVYTDFLANLKKEFEDRGEVKIKIDLDKKGPAAL